MQKFKKNNEKSALKKFWTQWSAVHDVTHCLTLYVAISSRLIYIPSALYAVLSDSWGLVWGHAGPLRHEDPDWSLGWCKWETVCPETLLQPATEKDAIMWGIDVSCHTLNKADTSIGSKRWIEICHQGRHFQLFRADYCETMFQGNVPEKKSPNQKQMLQLLASV